MKSADEAWLTTSKSEERLNDRQLEMYRDHRRSLLKWMISKGKNPEGSVGYAENTVKNRAHRLDLFYRWAWDIEGGYTENITVTHANAFMKYLHPLAYSQAYKAAFQKAIHNLFEWQNHELGKDVDWVPVIHYTDSGLPGNIEPLTREERTKLREAALSYGSIPSYNSVSPEEREQWKSYLAQREGKPKSEVSKDDWDRANSWKWPSLIWTALDAGLRPIEVSRAKVSWVDTKNALLRIPPEDAVKNSEYWRVGLQARTAKILDKWIGERENYEKYDDSELLWLTKYGNPYKSQSLNEWFHKLCGEAGIDESNRNLAWYSIRHSVGQEMVKELGVGGTAAQLRHKSMESTLQYIRASVDDRKDALERMG